MREVMNLLSLPYGGPEARALLSLTFIEEHRSRGDDLILSGMFHQSFSVPQCPDQLGSATFRMPSLELAHTADVGRDKFVVR